MGMSKEDIDALVKEIIGEAKSELRAEMEAKVKEAREEGRRYTHPLDNPNTAPRDRKANREKGIRAGRFIRIAARAKSNPDQALRIAKAWKDEEMIEAFEKSLNESVLESGGALVPGEFMEEVIELLRARTVVRAMGTPSIPMNQGSISISFLASASSAAYVGELANIAKSQPGFGMLSLTAKKLAGLVPVSNDLLKDASARADAIVRDDLVRTMSIREDLAFIRDDGTSNTPKGLLHQAAAGNVAASLGITLENKVNDLHDAMLRLENLNVGMTNAGWLMSPRTASGLSRQLDGDGNFVFRDEMAGGMLLGFPFKKTTSIPINLGAGAESEIYFVDFATCVIAEADEIEIQTFEGGAYHDGSGVVSGISTDQTVVRAIARHDFGARQRGQEIAVISEVAY